MTTLNNKRAFITGATSGIGEAVAHLLAKEGVDLILHGRDEAKLRRLEKDLGKKVDTVVFDVRNKDEVATMMKIVLEQFNVDILINNAGLALGLEPIDEGSIEQWEDMIDTNIKGLLYVSRAIIPQMRERDCGHIINIGSIAGRMTYPGGNVYCASKAAVHTLSEAMNVDLNDTAIRVANVAPGAVNTEFSTTRFSGDRDKADGVYDGYEPLVAQDVAELIGYILKAPLHVNIQDVLIMPTAQRNPYVLKRK